MRRYLFIFCAMFIVGLSAQEANAEIRVKDYMSYEFMDTQGYSGEMLRLVEVNKAKTFGEELPSHWPSNPIARGYRKVMAYLDPADDYGDFGTHEIHVRSTLWDY